MVLYLWVYQLNIFCMKKFLLLLLMVLKISTVSVFASTDYEYFKTQDGNYYCSVWLKDDSFESCSKFWFTNEADITELHNVGFSILPEFIIIWDKSYCVQESLEVDVSDCNKVKNFKYTDEWTFSCTHLDGVETCEKTTREEIDSWIAKNVENSISINWKSREEYQKDLLASPPESSIVANYFKKMDGSYYCTQWDKSLPSSKGFYYTLCSDIGLDSFSGVYLISSDGARLAKPDKVFEATETIWEWTHFSKLDELICLNKNAEEDTNCIVEYIERLDGSYTCSFTYINLNCAQYPKIINMDSGVPVWIGWFTVQMLPNEWSYLSHDSDPGKQVRYSNGKEIRNDTEFGAAQNYTYRETTNPWSISTTCTLNGKNVDCNEMAGELKSWFQASIWTLLFFGIIVFVAGIFWLLMLMHALSNPIPNKVVWVLLIFLMPFVWAIVYYFVIKRSYTRNMAQNLSPAYQMNPWVTSSEWPIYNVALNAQSAPVINQEPIATIAPIIATPESYNSVTTNTIPNPPSQ